MRRYTLEVQGRAFTIDVDELTADRFTVTVDDRTFEVALNADEDLPGATISPQFTPAQAGNHRRRATDGVNGVLEAASASGSAGPRPPGSAPGGRAAAPVHPPALAGGDLALLRAPMPGVILEVRVAPGACLVRGDEVAVLEAMKMRNTLRAPRDGVVAEILVQAGQPVALGDPLVRFGEPEA